jgi:hypothetical protein
LKFGWPIMHNYLVAKSVLKNKILLSIHKKDVDTERDMAAILVWNVNPMLTQSYANIKSSTRHRFWGTRSYVM